MRQCNLFILHLPDISIKKYFMFFLDFNKKYFRHLYIGKLVITFHILNYIINIFHFSTEKMQLSNHATIITVSNLKIQGSWSEEYIFCYANIFLRYSSYLSRASKNHKDLFYPRNISLHLKLFYRFNEIIWFSFCMNKINSKAEPDYFIETIK